MNTITNTKTTAPKRRGRPYKFGAATRKRLVAVIAKGVPLSHAAPLCGVSRSRFFEYRASHPKFEAAVQRAVARAIEKNLDLIITAAKSGDVSSAKWFLERCHAEHFSRNRLELSGPDGQPLAAAVALYLPQKNTPEPKPAITTEP